MSKASEQARALVAEARLGSLATRDDENVFATLVAIADDGAGRPLLVLSNLAEHTQRLRRFPQASILVVADRPDSSGQAGGTLDRPRVTLTGKVRFLEPAERPDAIARFLARHPEASQYVDLPGFGPARLELEKVHFVGGFARASAIPLGEYAGE